MDLYSIAVLCALLALGACKEKVHRRGKTRAENHEREPRRYEVNEDFQSQQGMLCSLYIPKKGEHTMVKHFRVAPVQEEDLMKQYPLHIGEQANKYHSVERENLYKPTKMSDYQYTLTRDQPRGNAEADLSHQNLYSSYHMDEDQAYGGFIGSSDRRH